MQVPSNLIYTKEHEWVRVEEKNAHSSAQPVVVTIGVTDYAQHTLGDIVYCELPKVGASIKQYQTFGVVESVKAVSDLYAPISGKVLESNAAVVEDPALINQHPYAAAWMLRVEVSDPKELQALLSAKDYEALIQEK